MSIKRFQSGFISTIYFGIILVVIFFSSCAFPRYTHNSEVKQNIDFSKGKWIINNIESPEGTNADLTRILLKKLKGDSLIYIDSLRLSYPLPNIIPFGLDSVMISRIRLFMDYDYIINVKVDIIDDDNKIQYLSAPIGSVKRKSEATIVIYDLRYYRKVYSDNVIASIVLGVNDIQIRYVKSSEKLMFSALREALKTLKKNAN